MSKKMVSKFSRSIFLLFFCCPDLVFHLLRRQHRSQERVRIFKYWIKIVRLGRRGELMRSDSVVRLLHRKHTYTKTYTESNDKSVNGANTHRQLWAQWRSTVSDAQTIGTRTILYPRHVPILYAMTNGPCALHARQETDRRCCTSTSQPLTIENHVFVSKKPIDFHFFFVPCYPNRYTVFNV